MLKILKRYAISTKIFQDDFLNFYKKQTPEIAISLAEKYFDSSIYVNDNVKYNFLKLASVYLKKVKKLTTKKEYKSKFYQKEILLEKGYKLLIRGKNEKVLKFLNKEFKEEDILPENKGLYDFINFVAYNKLKDKESAKIWYNKLKEDKNYKVYLLKSRKI